MKIPLFLLPVILIALSGCGQKNIAPPRTAANDFFQAVSESRLQEAYDTTTYAFQAQTSFNSFRSVAKEMELVGGTVICRWDKEERDNDDEVKLTGEVTGTGGTPIPAIVRLVNERGAWRILSLHDTANSRHQEVDRFSVVGKGAEFTRSSNLEIPGPVALEKLVKDTLLLFNDAVAHNNFGDFYSHVSATWQNQLTLGQLKRGFQPFVDAKVNLSEIENLKPVFDPAPGIDSKGILTLKGYFDTKPLRADFTLRYIYEFPYWKLFGLSMEMTDTSVKTPEPTPEPAASPEASATPQPSASPEASATPQPSASPEASATPPPSASPVPSVPEVQEVPETPAPTPDK
ncbi:MAG: hypothetical protein ACFUZC_09375 [Chthoniobacteraceae bacterium]